jgi:hypothetical protein
MPFSRATAGDCGFLSPAHLYMGSPSHRRLGEIQSISRGRGHRDEEAVAAHMKWQAIFQGTLFPLG